MSDISLRQFVKLEQKPAEIDRDIPLTDRDLAIIKNYRLIGVLPKLTGLHKYAWKSGHNHILLSRSFEKYYVSIAYSSKDREYTIETPEVVKIPNAIRGVDLKDAGGANWQRDITVNASVLKRALQNAVKRLEKKGKLQEQRGRPKVGMTEPQHKDGERVTLLFSPQEQKSDLAKKNAHKREGRIYDIQDTPQGKFYVIRLFVAVQGNEKAVDKLYGITDKNIKVGKKK